MSNIKNWINLSVTISMVLLCIVLTVITLPLAIPAYVLNFLLKNVKAIVYSIMDRCKTRLILLEEATRVKL